jgi:hypothetical protein
MDETHSLMVDMEIVRLKKLAFSEKNIAVALDLDYTTINRRWNRIRREMVQNESSGLDTKVVTLEWLKESAVSLLPHVVNQNNDPDWVPRADRVNAFVNVCKRMAELTGADAPTKVDINSALGDDETETAADRLADDLNRFMDMADQIARAGLGSGREIETDEHGREIVEAEVVDDQNPADVEFPAEVFEDESEPDEPESTPDNAIGRWVNGSFVLFEDELEQHLDAS